MKNILKKIVTSIIIWEAKMVLKKYQPKIIAVGGDVGKTTTKDAVYSAVKDDFRARKSLKSMNSDTGLPLSILGDSSGWNSIAKWAGVIIRGIRLITGKSKYPELLVLELGDGKPGDSKMLADWVKPDILIITHVDDIPTHVEFFDSIDESRNEKTDIVRAVKPGGVVITSLDDRNAMGTIVAAQRDDITLATYSNSNPDSLLNLSNIEIQTKSNKLGVKATINADEESKELFITGYLGRGVVEATAAALVTGYVLEIPLDSMIEVFNKEPDLPKGRMRVISGVKNTVLIDDTYNAGFASTKLALETLSQIPTNGRRIALLADMLELGEHSSNAHKLIGEICPEHCDILITVGKAARDISTSAKQAGLGTENVFNFSNSREAGKFTEQMIKPNDVILIKGSQSLRMERATQEMMLHPELREKLLVRQEKEWLKR